MLLREHKFGKHNYISYSEPRTQTHPQKMCSLMPMYTITIFKTMQQKMKRNPF